METEKKCSMCSEPKPLEMFYVRTGGKSLSSWCKECLRFYARVWRENHPDHSAAYQRKYEAIRRRDPRFLYGKYRKDAASRGIEFNLKFEEYLMFWQKPCYYCNVGIEFVGLDRVDNSKGYVLGNIVPCCTACNWMKRDNSRDEFIRHCVKVADIFRKRDIFSSYR